MKSIANCFFFYKKGKHHLTFSLKLICVGLMIGRRGWIETMTSPSQFIGLCFLLAFVQITSALCKLLSVVRLNFISDHTYVEYRYSDYEGLLLSIFFLKRTEYFLLSLFLKIVDGPANRLEVYS